MVITALLVVAVACIVGFGVALAVRSKREFAEQNEVVPGTKSPAPASWAGAHSREARLHRRLGDAVRAALQNPRFVELGLASQTKAIEAEALAIDERLVAVSGLAPAHKDSALDALENHVVELEQTIADMVTGVTVADSRELLQQAVSAADLRLHALAQARAEIEQIDRDASGVVELDGPLAAPPGTDGPRPNSPDVDDEPGTANG